MPEQRQDIVDWVAREVLPHEAELRGWLYRRTADKDEIEDLIQETYCRIAGLKSASHIVNGRAYLFQTARNILVEQLRRARIIKFEHVAEIDHLLVFDEDPSAERIVAARQMWKIVKSLIDGLPEKCRRVFELRRIQGLSQREIALRLNVSESTVEAHAARGLKRILEGMEAFDVKVTENEKKRHSPGN